MGYYCDFFLQCELAPNTPGAITDRLQFLIASDFSDAMYADPLYKLLDEHGCQLYRWRDDVPWELTVRSHLKNYKEEITQFLLLIEPWCTTRGFLGFMKYEDREVDAPVTLLYRYWDGSHWGDPKRPELQGKIVAYESMPDGITSFTDLPFEPIEAREWVEEQLRAGIVSELTM